MQIYFQLSFKEFNTSKFIQTELDKLGINYTAGHVKTGIIDVEGDKIYTDPNYVDKLSVILKNQNVDFVIGNDSKVKFNPSNHFIHGLIPAGFTRTALEQICNSKQTDNTETGYREFFTKSEYIKSQFLEIETNDFLNEIRLTLDYPEDLKLAEQIFQMIDNTFSKDDLITLFYKNPDLISITKNITKQWELNYEKNRTRLNF